MHFVTVLVLMRAAMFSLKRRSSTKTSNYRQNTGLYLSRIMSVQSSISLSMGDLNGFPSVTKKKRSIFYLPCISFSPQPPDTIDFYLFLFLSLSILALTHALFRLYVSGGFSCSRVGVSESESSSETSVWIFLLCTFSMFVCRKTHNKGTRTSDFVENTTD